MQRLILLCVLLLVWSVPIAIAQQNTDPALRAKIEGLQRQYSEAFHKADAASVASRYADDGILITPFSTISGKSAIEKNYVDLFKQGWNTEQTTLDEVLPLGAVVVAIGQFTLSGQAPNGVALQRKGRWTSVYEQRGDTLTLRVLTINVTPPSQPPASR